MGHGGASEPQGVTLAWMGVKKIFPGGSNRGI